MLFSNYNITYIIKKDNFFLQYISLYLAAIYVTEYQIKLYILWQAGQSTYTYRTWMGHDEEINDSIRRSFQGHGKQLSWLKLWQKNRVGIAIN